MEVLHFKKAFALREKENILKNTPKIITCSIYKINNFKEKKGEPCDQTTEVSKLLERVEALLVVNRSVIGFALSLKRGITSIIS